MRRALAFLLASQAAAMAASQEPPRFPSDVELVYLTIGAHDKKGRPIADLAPGELSIEEDGKRRAVAVLAASGTEPGDHTAVDVCVLVDTSGSVAAITERLTASALRVLRGLPRLRRRCVISFDNDVRVWREDAEPESLVRDVMQARPHQGATALNTALVTALDQLGEGAGRRVILLMSDGDDVGSRVTQKDAIEAVQRSSVVIFPITHAAAESSSLSPTPGVGGRPLSGGNTGPTNWNASLRYAGPAYLARLAELSGGRVYGSGDGDVEEVLARVAAEVAGQYVLGFAPASGYPGPRKIKIAVSRKDVKIRHRRTVVVRVPEP